MDYDLIRSGIVFLTENGKAQPDLAALGAHMGLSPSACQKLFKRWCGLSPKAFVQALTMDHARTLLHGSASVLETSMEVGLSGSGRLHDLFVDHEGMTPGDYKRRGEGLEIRYGFHPSPFGLALLMATPRGICGLAFADDNAARSDALADMKRRWPAADYREDEAGTKSHVERVFGVKNGRMPDQVHLVFIGTNFDAEVWQALLRIPVGQAVTYSDIAAHLGKPNASRAVGSAVGRNPISFVVPCHRVLRRDGGLGGYHWGVTRKQALIGWEAGYVAD